MTQKELLYVEDAISHEANIISYLEESVSKVSDYNVQEFFEKELNYHNKIKKDLLNFLKELSK